MSITKINLSKNLLVFLMLVIQLFYPIMVRAAEETVESGVDNEYSQSAAVLSDTTSSGIIYSPESTPANEDEGGSTDDYSKIIEKTTKNTYKDGLLGDRIILNPSDKRDLEMMDIIYRSVPDLKSDTVELGRLTGKNVDELNTMREEDWDSFAKIATEAEGKYFSDEYVQKRMLGQPNLVAELLGVSEIQAVEQMQKASGLTSIKAAIANALSIKIDRRVINTLLYLVRPKDSPLGGAGHYRIKVYRLRRNYDRDQNMYSRESDAAQEEKDKTASETENLSEQTVQSYTDAENGTEIQGLLADSGLQQNEVLTTGTIQDEDGKDISDYIIADNESEEIISAHFSGQAVDISEIDDIRCTLIEKRRLGGDTKKPQPPMNIKLLWQTKEGYSSDKGAIDSSFNDMFRNYTNSALQNILEELNITVESLDAGDISNFGDVATLVGQVYFAQILDIPAGGDIWNFDLKTTLIKIGGSLLADKLDMPKEPFIDGNIKSADELYENVGRYVVENGLNLPYGALKGKDRDEILENAGIARILEEADLPEGSLDVSAMNQANLYQKIGSRILENEYGFEKGVFYKKTDFSEMKDYINEKQLSLVFSFPESVDYKLGLQYGTTKKMKSGSMSLKEYIAAVAQAHISQKILVYAAVEKEAGSVFDDGGTSDLNDSVFNLPSGTMQAVVDGNLTKGQLKAAGVRAIAYTLESGDASREALEKWLNNPSSDFKTTETITDSETGETSTKEITLPKDEYAAQMGVRSEEVWKVLGSDENPTSTYVRLGKKALQSALIDSSYFDKKKDEILSQNPDLADAYQELDFYLSRVSIIGDKVDDLADDFSKLKAMVDTAGEEVVRRTIGEDPKEYYDFLNKLSAFTDLAKTADSYDSAESILRVAGQLTESSDGVLSPLYDLNRALASSADSMASQFLSQMNLVKDDLEYILKNTYEIVTGQEQSGFSLEDISLSEFDFSQFGSESSSIGAAELVMFLAGEIDFDQLMIGVGSAKIGDELGLPGKAMMYAANAISIYKENQKKKKSGDEESFRDIFVRAIGMSLMGADMTKVDDDLFFDPELLFAPVSVTQLRDNIEDRMNISRSRANLLVAESFGLGNYDLEALISGNFSAWSKARADAEAFDIRNGMTAGTTERFIKGEPDPEVDESALSDDDIRLFSTKLHISETAIKTFIMDRDGKEIPTTNQIYFVDKNKYMADNDTESYCEGKVNPDSGDAVKDGTYYYYDKDGLHTFATFAEANEYQKDNGDKKLNYKEEMIMSLFYAVYRVGGAKGGEPNPDNGVLYDEFYINNYDVASSAVSEAKSFLAKYADANSFGSSIKKFLSGNEKGFAFSEEEYQDFANVLYLNYDIPTEITEKILKRTNDSSAAFGDFLKILGAGALNKLALSYINDELGFYVGSTKVTPMDLFDLFNGGGVDSFAKIGGQILDDELGMEQGTMEDVISADSAAVSKCALDRAGAQMLGNLLGIDGLDLEGIFYNNIGGTKIENVLGLPRGTFKGASLDDLIANVGILNFTKAFQYPYPSEAEDKVESKMKEIGDEFYQANRSRDFYDKWYAVSNYEQALGNQFTDIDEIMNGVVGNISSQPIILASDTKTASGAEALTTVSGFTQDSRDSAEHLINLFYGKMEQMDRKLSVEDGSTRKLLKGTLSPDQYRNQCSSGTLTSAAIEAALNLLGISGIDSKEVKDFVKAVKDISDSGNQAKIYEFVSDLFSVNLDEKAGFSRGTIKKIIMNPKQAEGIILGEAGKKVDAMLGFDHPVFELYATTYFADAQKYCTSKGLETGSLEYNKCMAQKRGDRAETEVKRGVTNWMCDEIEDILQDILQVKVVIERDDDGKVKKTKKIKDFQIEITKAKWQGLMAGDLRLLTEFSIVYGLGQLYKDTDDIFGLSSDGRLDAQSMAFKILYEDITNALYGNDELEAQVRSQGEGAEWFALTYDGTAASIGPFELYDPTSGDLTETGPSTGLAYTAWQSTSSTALTEKGLQLTSTATVPSTGEEVTLTSDLAASDTTLTTGEKQQIAKAGSDAVTKARDEWKNYLKYKLIDCTLRSKDKNIPPDFARRMFDGNSFSKNAAITDYIANIIGNAVGLESIPLEFRKDMANFLFGKGSAMWPEALAEAEPITEAAEAAKETAGGDSTESVKEQEEKLFNATDSIKYLAEIDKYLIERGPDIFGVKLAKGTTEGLIAFIANGGKWDDNFQIAGVNFRSLGEIYNNDWVISKASIIGDQLLGLPSGSCYQAYKLNQNIKKAKAALATAKSKGDVDKIKAAKSNLSAAKAELISYIVTTVFSKQIGQMEQSLGLVPGTGSMLVTMLITGFNPITLAIFVVANLIGVYRVEYVCTADGYYPKAEDRPDPSKWDSPNLGTWNGLNESIRQDKMIEAAQYKATRLIGDLLLMPTATGDEELLPTQIMTGREEDIQTWNGMTDEICNKVGASAPTNGVCGGGSRAGLWQNPQTTMYTHIGF